MSSGPQLENDLVVEDGARTRSAPSRRPRFAVPPKRIAPFNVPIVLDNYYSAAPRRLRLRGNGGDDGAQDSSGMSFAAAFEDNVWERSASMGDLNNTPGESQDENTLKPGALECIAFALCGVGVSVGWTTVLANLTYFCGLYGKSSFIWLNVAVYGPTLPFAIIQTAFDQRFDARFGSSRAFSFRLVTALLSMAVLMVLYPILLATPASVQAGKIPSTSAGFCSSPPSLDACLPSLMVVSTRYHRSCHTEDDAPLSLPLDTKVAVSSPSVSPQHPNLVRFMTQHVDNCGDSSAVHVPLSFLPSPFFWHFCGDLVLLLLRCARAIDGTPAITRFVCLRRKRWGVPYFASKLRIVACHCHLAPVQCAAFFARHGSAC